MNSQVMLRVLLLVAALPLFANAANVSTEPQPLGSALQDLAKQWRESAESVQPVGRRGS